MFITCLPIILDHFFHWIDNTRLSFTNWQPGEPNGEWTGEDVVEMKFYSHEDEWWGNSKAGQWNDLSPTETKAFLCSHPRT